MVGVGVDNAIETMETGLVEAFSRTWPLLSWVDMAASAVEVEWAMPETSSVGRMVPARLV